MLRSAKGQDIPVIIEMVAALHRATRMAVPVDEAVTRATLQSLIVRTDGLLVVSERSGALTGFLAASVGFASVSSAPVAHEHGWYSSERGAGLKLLLLYEKWANERGCRFIRMSTPPNNERASQVLDKRGYRVSELAWVKEI